MKKAINNTDCACAIVINKLSYIAIFDYIRKEDCDVLLHSRGSFSR